MFKDAFANIMKFTGCNIEDAVKMSSVNQAREFNLTSKGAIEAGKDEILTFSTIRWNLKQRTASGGF